ncbi:MAG: CHRD domain-containing protein [Solirubrobacteraceae bacterium]|jgi:hypothetical protein
MPGRTAFVCLAAVLAALAGCGSTKKGAATSSPQPPGLTETGAPAPVKSVTYKVILAGTNGGPPGVPDGYARAVLRIEVARRELCWSFSRLQNVTAPTTARVYRNPSGTSVEPGVRLSATYRPSGCAREPAAFLGLLALHPLNFYLRIDSVRYPNGAVRGVL